MKEAREKKNGAKRYRRVLSLVGEIEEERIWEKSVKSGRGDEEEESRE